jgi:gliding motility-associated-like protein
MKNQLEDQIKNSFGDFEPEVDPTVWTRISSQLPAATPQSPGTPGADSGFLSSLGNAGTWLVASAAVVISGTALYFALSDDPKPTEVNQDQTITNTIPPQQDVNTTPETESHTVISDKTESAPESEKSTDIVQPSEKSKTTSDVITNQSANVAVADNQSPATISSGSPANTHKPVPQETAPIVSSTQNSAAQEKPKSNAESAPLRLIVNTNGGFAPLSVTVLLNQTGIQGEIDFGDGNKTLAQSATHQYKEPGIYLIECRSGDQVATQEIEVLDEIPSAFSPNADGMNDVFEAGSQAISEVEIRIFNRQGRIIHADKGSSVKWNGLYSDGSPAETGTYFYDIFVTSQRGNIYKQKGNITLFR